MSEKNEQLALIADRMYTKLPVTESTLALAALAGFALKITEYEIGRLLLMLSLSALAIFYFLISFRTPEAESTTMKKFINKVIDWGASVSVLGILFILQNYERNTNLIIIGSLSLIIALILNYAINKILDRRTLIRTIVLILIGLSLFLTPKEKLYELHIIKPRVEHSNNQ